MLMSWTVPVERLVSELASGLEKGTHNEAASPKADVVDRSGAYELIVEMPGVGKDALSIELNRDELVLGGTRKAIDEGRLLTNGRRAALPFAARFALGDDIDRTAIKARLEDGLVYVTLPRREAEKPRRIEVEIG